MSGPATPAGPPIPGWAALQNAARCDAGRLPFADKAVRMKDRFKARFDGSQAWHHLPPDVRDAIGATALELAVAWQGAEAADAIGDYALARPFEAADGLCIQRLEELVETWLPAMETVVGTGAPVPVPSILGPVCRRCGCSDRDACLGMGEPCGWAEADLCTACARTAESAA